MSKTVSVGPVYPPYQLDNFQRCPLFWDLDKRWKKPLDKEWTAGTIGNAVAKGLEEYLSNGPEKAQELAKAFGESNYVAKADRSLKGMLELIRQGVELGMATRFGMKEILAVEQPFGRTRPDRVGRDYDGALAVWDHKVKVQLDDKFYEKELARFDRSNQFYEYAWIVGQEYGEPVERVYAHLIILGPSPRTVLHPVKMEPEHIRHWLHGASRDWKIMRAIENGDEEAYPHYTGCQTDYGPCAMYEGCHTFYGDESAFPAIYERVKGRYAS